MNTLCIEQSKAELVVIKKAELVVIKGFEGEDIEVSVEQLEPRITPGRTAGFLE